MKKKYVSPYCLQVVIDCSELISTSPENPGNTVPPNWNIPDGYEHVGGGSQETTDEPFDVKVDNGWMEW